MITPLVAGWLNIGVVALGAVAGMDPHLFAFAGPAAVQGAGAAIAVAGVVNSYLHMTSPAVAGPFASKP